MLSIARQAQQALPPALTTAHAVVGAFFIAWRINEFPFFCGKGGSTGTFLLNNVSDRQSGLRIPIQKPRTLTMTTPTTCLLTLPAEE